MLVFCLLIILILIILIIAIFASGGSNYFTSNSFKVFRNNSFRYNFKQNKKRNKKRNKKENYGPPPGRQPAVNYLTLGYRGWPSAPYEYSGVTASALINYVEPWPEYKYQQSW